MSNAPPGKARARRETGRRRNDELDRRIASPAAQASRELQLLCCIAKSQINIESRLGDIATLAQQQNDLLRRIVNQEVER